MNRLQRLSSILIHLQSGGWITAKDIAYRFEITSRTVYRDMQSLHQSGVPVISEAGRGYRLVDGYKLPPVQFTYNEAAALITAEKLIERHTDKSLDKEYKSALYKIKAILKQTDKDYLHALEDNIQVLANPYLPTDRSAELSDAALQPLIDAITHKKLIHLRYQSREKEELSSRYVEPIGIFQIMSKWHIIGYCRLRKDYRDFRLDRVKEMNISADRFTQSHPTLKKYLSKIVYKENLIKVVIRMKKEHVRYLGDQKYYNGYVSERVVNDEVELTFLTGSLKGFAHWYMMIGAYAKLLEPITLKAIAMEMACEVIRKLK